MGLKAEGRLKADLQRCLLEAIHDADNDGDGDAHAGEGGHASKNTKGTTRRVVSPADEDHGGGDDEAGDAEEDEADKVSRQSRKGRATRRDAVGPPTPSASPVGRGRTHKKRAHQAETSPSPAPAFSPDRVRFHREAVSAMSPERMREALHDLDMPSLRKEDDEVMHDLVDALVQRKAEAADTNPRKQAWRGRPVYMMRKAELQHMLERFDKDSTGKAEELRARFRAVLREWAADDIDIPLSGVKGGTSGGGASTAASHPQNDDEEVSSGTEDGGGGRRRGRQSRTTRTCTQVESEDAGPEKPKPKARPSKASATTSSSPSRRAPGSSSNTSNTSSAVGGGVEPAGSRGTRSRRRRPADEAEVSPEKGASSSSAPAGEVWVGAGLLFRMTSSMHFFLTLGIWCLTYSKMQTQLVHSTRASEAGV